MPSLTYQSGSLSVNGVTINDPARDTTVDPVLWELRRERRVELMMEGRRGDDLRRWAKWEYLNSEDINGNPSMTFLGAYVDLADYPGVTYEGLFDPTNPSNNKATKGYINYLKVSSSNSIRKFVKGDLNSERNYLRAIPASQITNYNDKGFTLTQNPGW